MNVGELKYLLEQYPDDMPVIQEIYSDYRGVEPEYITIEKAVYKKSVGYYMRYHSTMSEENKAQQVECLCISGN